MEREIGSEFHKMPIETGKGLTFPHHGSLVFSGRTAIEAVLDMLPDVQTALLPSYCCDSMIVPFRAAGIDVRFYDVNWDNGLKVEIKGSADVLLWCNYFGFKIDMPGFAGVIIEDITHSLLSERQCHKHSHFLVGSLRKWEPIICGGYCSIKVEGAEPLEEFINLKADAMDLKTEYLADLDERKKIRFLSMFEESNEWLARHYSGLTIDPWSKNYIECVDIEKQRSIRRKNAKVLYDELEGKVHFLFPIEDMDCPLFVPILIPSRDEVKTHLIKNKIYCPVHWPRPEGCESNLYDYELSLICDQRYGIDDMERIVSVLLEVINDTI